MDKKSLQQISAKYRKLNPNVGTRKDVSGQSPLKSTCAVLGLLTLEVRGLSIRDHQKVLGPLGYEVESDFFFSAHKVIASVFVHKDPNLPKIVVSSLLVDKLDREIAEKLVDRTSLDPVETDLFTRYGSESAMNSQIGEPGSHVDENPYVNWLMEHGPSPYLMHVAAVGRSNQDLSASSQILSSEDTQIFADKNNGRPIISPSDRQNMDLSPARPTRNISSAA